MKSRNRRSAFLDYREVAASVSNIEMRDDEDKSEFYGRSIVFDEFTDIGNPYDWGFHERVGDKAANKTIKERDQVFLVNHDTSLVVARRSTGSLEYENKDDGLYTIAQINRNVSYANDLAENVRTGRVTGQSFGFIVVRDEWNEKEEKLVTSDDREIDVVVMERTILEMELLETSAVTFPAYEGTTASLRQFSTDPLKSAGLAYAYQGEGFLSERAKRNDTLCDYRDIALLRSRNPAQHREPSARDTSADELLMYELNLWKYR